MNSRTQSARTQRGWSLVEAVVVAALVGVMGTGLWKTLEFANQRSRTEQSRDQLQRAEDALYAIWLSQNQLPQPDGARASPNRPNHLEGWLPQHVLGTARPRQFWYVVDSTLVRPPTATFRLDPMNLLDEALPDGDAAGARMNLCLSLVNRERAGVSAGNGLRAAFALQQVEPDDHVIEEGTFRGQLVRGLRLGPPPTDEQDAGSKGRVRAVGYSEALHRFNCFAAFAAVAAEVKSAALFKDLTLLADQEVQFRELGVKATLEGIQNHQWRITNTTILLATDSWSLVNALLSVKTTPVGMVLGAIHVAGYATQLYARGISLQFSLDSLERNERGLPGARQAVDNAVDYRTTLETARNARWNRLKALQQEEPKP